MKTISEKIDNRLHLEKCSKCETEVATIQNGLCFFCRMKENGEMGKCSGCKEETPKTGLKEKLCYWCREKIQQREQKKRSLEALYVKAMGGEYNLLNFRFDLVKRYPGNEKAYDACRVFNPKGENLFFYGHTGAGKTTLAGCVVYDNLSKGRWNCQTYTPKSLFRKIRKNNFKTEEEQLARVIAAEVLVINDLGVENVSDASISTLLEVIDERQARRKNGLIVTSNYSLAEVTERLKDDRISSRINFISKVLKVEGPLDKGGKLQDWRKIIKKQKKQEAV